MTVLRGRGLVSACTNKGEGKFVIKEGDRLILPQESSLQYILTSMEQSLIFTSS